MTEIKQIFQENIVRYQAKHQTLAKKDKRLSATRLILFLGSIALVVYAANDRNGTLLFAVMVAFFIVFGLLIRYHNKIKFKSQNALFLSQLNEEEVQRDHGDFHGLKHGDEYLDKNHAYAPDLDIFGSNSLFQLIVRSRLFLTQKLASEWMLNKSDKDIIKERQLGIEELTSRTAWRQQFTSYGMHHEKSQTKSQVDSFGTWMADRNDFITKPFWKVVNWVMPIVSLTTIIGLLFSDLPYQVIFIPILINTYLLKFSFEPLLKLTKDFDQASKSLKTYERLFGTIEATSFESSILKELKAELLNNGKKASDSVRTLRRILDQLMNRGNMLYFPLNVLFVLDLFWLRQAEIWKGKNGKKVANWFRAVHEFDLLNDMASFAYANPNYAFPEVLEEKFVIKAVELGHPLIHEDVRVNNTFEFAENGFMGLVTGSNMSGKSTFLRTVGLNMVMAQMGLPVCAKSFSFSLTRVFSGMRTTDNLEESVSSFYAELARIKTLLDSINDKEPIFYLLDEILKGTNSEDRHKGSISLIKQLTAKHAFGLISTHDLTLSSLEKNNDKVKNYSFNSTIEGNEILFDYKLTDGPCRSFNASKLMEKMGIIVE